MFSTSTIIKLEMAGGTESSRGTVSDPSETSDASSLTGVAAAGAECLRDNLRLRGFSASEPVQVYIQQLNTQWTDGLPKSHYNFWSSLTSILFQNWSELIQDPQMLPKGKSFGKDAFFIIFNIIIKMHW